MQPIRPNTIQQGEIPLTVYLQGETLNGRTDDEIEDILDFFSVVECRSVDKDSVDQEQIQAPVYLYA